LAFFYISQKQKALSLCIIQLLLIALQWLQGT